MNSNDVERVILNAALERLFRNEYRESSDRHSDALYVREHVLELWKRAERAESALRKILAEADEDYQGEAELCDIARTAIDAARATGGRST